MFLNLSKPNATDEILREQNIRNQTSEQLLAVKTMIFLDKYSLN